VIPNPNHGAWPTVGWVHIIAPRARLASRGPHSYTYTYGRPCARGRFIAVLVGSAPRRIRSTLLPLRCVHTNDVTNTYVGIHVHALFSRFLTRLTVPRPWPPRPLVQYFFNPGPFPADGPRTTMQQSAPAEFTDFFTVTTSLHRRYCTTAATLTAPAAC